jgi:hypothetical protein
VGDLVSDGVGVSRRCNRGGDDTDPTVIVGPVPTFPSGNRYGDDLGPRTGSVVPNRSSSEGVSVEGIEPPDDDLLAPPVRSGSVIDPILFSRRVQLGELKVVSEDMVLVVASEHDLTRSIKVCRLEPGKDRSGYRGCSAHPGAALGEWEAGGMQLALLVDCLQLNEKLGDRPAKIFADGVRHRLTELQKAGASASGMELATRFLDIMPSAKDLDAIDFRLDLRPDVARLRSDIEAKGARIAKPLIDAL